mgnify:CR=1 FL=1
MVMLLLIRRDAIRIIRRTSPDPIDAATAIPMLPKGPRFPRMVDEAPAVPAERTTTATPRLAPAERPKTSGPARGFRKRVCISRPATASDAPAKMPTTAVGSR